MKGKESHADDEIMYAHPYTKFYRIPRKCIPSIRVMFADIVYQYTGKNGKLFQLKAIYEFHDRNHFPCQSNLK